jgi:rubrerythrin
MAVFARSVAMIEDICDFIDGSGIVDCPDCGEVVETDVYDRCPICYNGKYANGDI